MKNKNATLIVSVTVAFVSFIIILATQFLSGGSNPNGHIMLILLSIIGGSIQTIFFSIFDKKFPKIIPLLISAAIAVWGTYCFIFSDSWINATLSDLLFDYYSPMFGCLLSIIFSKIVLRDE